jgi:hypothetical protein
LKKLSAVIMAGMGFLLIVLCGRSSAQSLSSLSQMFGGGSKQSNNSSQSNAAITVKRNAAPFLGTFDGKQTASSGSQLNARFACYPAHDSALPHENTFVCYTAEGSGGAPHSAEENIDR